MDDFNFRLSLQTEDKVKKGIENFILENWRKSKKEFRYLNRVSFRVSGVRCGSIYLSLFNCFISLKTVLLGKLRLVAKKEVFDFFKG